MVKYDCISKCHIPLINILKNDLRAGVTYAMAEEEGRNKWHCLFCCYFIAFIRIWIKESTKREAGQARKTTQVNDFRCFSILMKIREDIIKIDAVIVQQFYFVDIYLFVTRQIHEVKGGVCDELSPFMVSLAFCVSVQNGLFALIKNFWCSIFYFRGQEKSSYTF